MRPPTQTLSKAEQHIPTNQFDDNDSILYQTQKTPLQDMSYFYGASDCPYMPPMGPTMYPGMTPSYGGGYPPLLGLGPIAGPSRHHGGFSSETEYKRLKKVTERLASGLGGALGHLLYDLSVLDRRLGGQLSNLAESRSAKEGMVVLPHLIKAAKLTEHAYELFGDDLARFFNNDASSDDCSSDASSTSLYLSDLEDDSRRRSKYPHARKHKMSTEKAGPAKHPAKKHKEHSGGKHGQSSMRHGPFSDASDIGDSYFSSLPPSPPVAGPSNWNSYHHDWPNVPHGLHHSKKGKSKHAKKPRQATVHTAPESPTLVAPAPVSPSQSQKDLHLGAEEAVVAQDKAPETQA